MINIFKWLAIYLLLCTVVRAHDIQYVVQEGETLSEILFRYYDNTKHRLYGPRGKVVKVSRDNPHIKNPNKLEKGEILLLKSIDPPITGKRKSDKKNFFYKTHIVKRGEVFSKILLRYINNKKVRLYGRNGKIRETLKINRHIKNPNVLDVGQIVYIRLSKTSIAKKEKKPPDKKKSVINNNIGPPQISLKFGLGGNLYSTVQTGALGTAKGTFINLNLLSMGARFDSSNWFGEIDYSQFSYRIKDPVLGVSERTYFKTATLKGGHKWFYGGLLAEESPLFRLNRGSVEFTETGQLFAIVGFNKREKYEKFYHELDFMAGYMVKSDSNSPSITISNQSGYKIQSFYSLGKRLSQTETYSTFLGAKLHLGHESYQGNINWSPVSGIVKKTATVGSFSLFFDIHF